jgi:hypothetical protein
MAMKTNGASKRRLFKTSARRRATVRRAARKRRARFLALGLTGEGAPRTNHQHHLPCGLSIRQKTRRYAAFRRHQLTSAGLSTYFPRWGQPIVERQKHNLFAGLSQREKHYARMATYRARNVAAGLTSKGKPRKPIGLQPSALELAWREFRATIHIPQHREWDDYGMTFASRENKIAEAA